MKGQRDQCEVGNVKRATRSTCWPVLGDLTYVPYMAVEHNAATGQFVYWPATEGHCLSLGPGDLSLAAIYSAISRSTGLETRLFVCSCVSIVVLHNFLTSVGHRSARQMTFALVTVGALASRID